MRRSPPSRIIRGIVAALASGLAWGAAPVQAQNSPGGPPPTNSVLAVTVTAPDPQATEPGTNIAFFSLNRLGPTNEAVLVFFQIGGTASNGADYAMLSSPISIPAGQRSLRLTIQPIDDADAEPLESVQLRLVPSPLAGPLPTYQIGFPSNAVVTIADNDSPPPPPPTNRPPFIQIATPRDGEMFPAQADIVIAANVTDPDPGGFVATVEFFEGTNSLGFGTNNPLVMLPGSPFLLVWSNVRPGEYRLTARATDDLGAMSHSLPVHVKVGVTNPPPQPVVNVMTVDPEGREIPEVPPGLGMPQSIDPVVFRVTRSGSTGFVMTVFYRLGGRASNGVDYAGLPGTVTIPEGGRSADIVVLPVDDLLPEGDEPVDVTLEPPACIAIFPPPPDCYLVGPQGRAFGVIHDNDGMPPGTNQPPTVRIIGPPNGARFPAPACIPIDAVTTDPDGFASHVEFFEGPNKIGESTIIFIQPPPPGQPIFHHLDWTNVPPGEYVLTARTMDNEAAMGLSAPVHVSVVTNLPPPPPPPSNQPPILTIAARDSFASEGTNLLGRANTATFVVRRSAGTNLALTVPYRIGGTASNGADYALLSGFVTIPAGSRSAEIVIDPIDDGVREPIESVVLALPFPPLPPPGSTNPLPYVVGWPNRAAAVIVDNDQPRPPTTCLPDRLFHFCLPVANGHCHRVEFTTNLVHWMPICTNSVLDGAVHFVDPEAPEHKIRCYRIVPVPCPPSDE